MGRLSADIYPAQIRTPLREQRNYVRYVGGFAGNVSTGLARLEVRTAIVSKVGNDGHGEFIRDFLSREGVDVGWLGIDHTLNTPIVFCEIWPPDRFPLLFYREPTAPDMTITTAELPRDAIRDAALFWTTGTGLSAEPSRSATLAALETARGLRVHDLDHRPSLWPAGEEPRRWAGEAVRRATVVVGNLDEVEMATGLRDHRAAAAALLELGPRLVVVKRGPDGAYARTARDEVSVPAIRITVLNGLGAGDAFGGALCHGLLAGWGLARALAVANAAGAIVASRLACADAMPTLAEIEAVLAQRVTT